MRVWRQRRGVAGGGGEYAAAGGSNNFIASAAPRSCASRVGTLHSSWLSHVSRFSYKRCARHHDVAYRRGGGNRHQAASWHGGSIMAAYRKMKEMKTAMKKSQSSKMKMAKSNGNQRK
jgi:hypothetical protein